MSFRVGYALELEWGSLLRVGVRSRDLQDVEAEASAAHSSPLFMRRPTQADDAWRLGKIPTESVRRRISRLRRSLGCWTRSGVHTPIGEGTRRRRSPWLDRVNGGELVVHVVQEPVVLR